MSLNSEQRAAATAPISQPLAIVAGAGCGKTATLVERVRHITRSEPAATVVVLTFSNKAAAEVRSRCAAFELNVTCLTFHSFALKMLNEFSEEEGARFKPLGQTATSKLVGEAVAEAARSDGAEGWTEAAEREDQGGDDEDKRAATAKRMVAVISKAKGRMITPEQLADPHARDVYSRYQSKMRAAGHTDFEDLILRCDELLGKRRVVDMVTAKFSHALVDEYQDTSASQLSILTRLYAESGNITVVGDDDQMIYGWRNAMPDAFGAFITAFPRARSVQLTQHYRCTSLILRAACSVVKPISGRHKAGKKGGSDEEGSDCPGTEGEGGELWTNQPVGEPIRVLILPDSSLSGGEAGYASARVLELLNMGKMPREIAVLCRTNSEVLRSVLSHLSSLAVPCTFGTATGGGSAGGGGATRGIFRHSVVSDALAYLHVVADERDNDAFLRVLRRQKGIGKAFEKRLAQEVGAGGRAASDSEAGTAKGKKRATATPPQSVGSLMSAARRLLEDAKSVSTATKGGRSGDGVARKISATQCAALRSLFGRIDELFLATCSGGPIGAVDAVCRLLLPSQTNSSATPGAGRTSTFTGASALIEGTGRDGPSFAGGFQKAKELLHSVEAEELHGSGPSTKARTTIKCTRSTGGGGGGGGGGSSSNSSLSSAASELAAADSVKTSVARDQLSSFRALAVEAMAAASPGPSESASNGSNSDSTNSTTVTVAAASQRTMSDEELAVLLARNGEAELVNLQSLLDTLATLAEEGGGTEKGTGNGGAVTVGTIHASKGLEYNHVILLHLNDGTLPSLRGDDSLGETIGSDGTEGGPLCRNEGELEDEERRLLHVCISRAKESFVATLSAASDYGSEHPSRFLADIPGDCISSGRRNDKDVRRKLAEAERRYHDLYKAKQSKREGIVPPAFPLVPPSGPSPPLYFTRPVCPTHQLAARLIVESSASAPSFGAFVSAATSLHTPSSLPAAVSRTTLTCASRSCEYHERLGAWMARMATNTAHELSGASAVCSSSEEEGGATAGTRRRSNLGAGATAGLGTICSFFAPSKATAKGKQLPSSAPANGPTTASQVQVSAPVSEPIQAQARISAPAQPPDTPTLTSVTSVTAPAMCSARPPVFARSSKTTLAAVTAEAAEAAASSSEVGAAAARPAPSVATAHTSPVCMHGEGPDCAACARINFMASGKENTRQAVAPQTSGSGPTSTKIKAEKSSKPRKKAKLSKTPKRTGAQQTTAVGGAAPKAQAASAAKRPRAAKSAGGKDNKPSNQTEISMFFGQGRLTGKSARRNAMQREANQDPQGARAEAPPMEQLAAASLPGLTLSAAAAPVLAPAPEPAAMLFSDD